MENGVNFNGVMLLSFKAQSPLPSLSHSRINTHADDDSAAEH